ncbi:helix-hairpin-helix domain-containing protein [Cognatilysobacter lacus]|uniref:Mitomycin resistance protein n=1 Tax=Cognatilysobacter lacus TaxID=1643323 RepID=A0A5D8Z5W8_9GAMM|nr:helix-hairpin-helix domain-containing protein [Lysobacter lacus]TZF90139.1 mitomycin resistance protein [Lysobacter lacus]
MNPARVDRSRLHDLTDLPNVGPSVAGDLRRIGIERPSQLVGQSPLELYRRLCEVTGARQDPCVLDVFMSVTRFMDGEAPRPWWAYTAERKLLVRK